MKWRKAQENNADRKSPFWFQAHEIPYGLSGIYIYLYNFYSSVNVVEWHGHCIGTVSSSDT